MPACSVTSDTDTERQDFYAIVSPQSQYLFSGDRIYVSGYGRKRTTRALRSLIKHKILRYDGDQLSPASTRFEIHLGRSRRLLVPKDTATPLTKHSRYCRCRYTYDRIMMPMLVQWSQLHGNYTSNLMYRVLAAIDFYV